MSGTAGARPVERGHFSDSFSEEVDCGDFAALVEVDVDWAFVLNPHGRDRLAYGIETSHGRQLWTNLATGKTLTVDSNFVVKDLRVTHIGDGTLTILVQSAGGVNVYGPDGKLLLREPGLSRSLLLIGDGGTPTDPTDDVFLADLGRVKGSTGRNDLDGTDLCGVLRAHAA